MKGPTFDLWIAIIADELRSISPANQTTRATTRRANLQMIKAGNGHRCEQVVVI
jgi:hypothetical protein